MRELALFAGVGGGILGGRLLGWRTVCGVEIDPFCREVLLRRQLDGCLPRFPIWDDVRTFDGNPWCGKIDVISGGFPCQDISCAGTHKGLTGARSGLVHEMLRIIGEVRPAFVFAENSPNLRTNGLGEIVEALSSMGYVGRVGVLGAWHVGAPHRRNRMWIVANDKSQQAGIAGQPWIDKSVGWISTYSTKFTERESPDEIHPESESWKTRGEPACCALRGISPELSSDRCGQGRARRPSSGYQRQLKLAFQTTNTDGNSLREQPGWSGWPRESEETSEPGNNSWWPVDIIQGVDDGLSDKLDRVKATGNAQVPAVARLAWKVLSGTE